MTREKEVLRMALEALERSVATCFDQRSHDAVMGRPEHFVNQAITAIKEALAQPEQIPPSAYSNTHQPEQEPHSWYSKQEDEWMTHKTRKEHERLNSYTHKVGKFDLALYTTPPQRTWTGLTDEDYDLLSDRWWKPNESEQALIDWVIERLKEKNT